MKLIRPYRAFCVSLLFVLGSNTGRPATLTWTNTAGSDWNTAANWSPNQVPGAGDHVIINSGAVTVPANATFASMDWNGGQLSGALTVASTGVLNISGSAEKDLVCPLTNWGTVTWTGPGELRVLYYTPVNDYGAIYNLAGGLFDIQTDALLDNYAGPEVFNNAGTVRKSAGGGTTTVNPQFNNTGTVAALTGTVAFKGGGNLGGQYTTASGTGINLVSGSFVQAGAPVCSGGGQSQITAGTLTLTSDLIPGLAMNGGTLYVSPSFQGGSITNLTLTGMILAGTNVVGGLLNWTTNEIQGSLTVLSTGMLNISGSAEKDLVCPLTNWGTVIWTGPGELRVLNYSPVTYFGAIYNLAGGLFDIQTDALLDNYAGPEVFNNAGTVRKSAGGGTTTIKPQFNNTGTVAALTGTLAFKGGGNLGGQYTTASGTGINLVSGSFVQAGAPVCSGGGQSQITAGTLTLTSDLIPGLAMNGGTLYVSPSFQGGSITNLTLTGMILAGTNVVGGTLNWTTNEIQGSLTVLSTGVLNISGRAEKDLSCPLTNWGTVTWTGPGELRVLYYTPVNDYGAIYNLAGGLFDIQTDALLDNYAGPEVFNNAGTVRKSAGGGTTTVNPQFNNTGTVAALTGTVAFKDGGNLGGQYTTASGTGINLVSGSFVQAGAPVCSGGGQSQITAGTLTLTSDLIPGLAMNGGTLYVSPSFQGGSITNLTLTGMILAGTNAVGGTLNWTTNEIQGSLTVLSTGVLNLSGRAEKDLSCPLTNWGTVTWTGSGELRVLHYTPFNEYGAIYNLAGGLFDIQTDALLDNYAGIEVFNNAGTVRKSAGGSTTAVNPQFDNTGTVAALTGTLAFKGGFNITGGELLFGMSGPGSYGKISIAGNVMLGGTVGVVWLGGFVPASGNSFTLVSYGSYGGVFTNTDFPTAAVWQTNYTSTSFILSVGGLNKLVFAVQPLGGKLARAILAPVVVQVEDPAGNPIATTGTPVTLSLESGTGVLAGTLTQGIDSTGKATCGDLSLGTIGTKTLRASAPGLSTATSLPFEIVPLIQEEWTGGGFLLQFNGTNDLGPVVIYASTNLVSWVALYTNPPTSGPIQFLDSSATNYPFRFYRALGE